MSVKILDLGKLTGGLFKGLKILDIYLPIKVPSSFYAYI
jgi:hypothetical protein